jgi:hypothetical protein
VKIRHGFVSNSSSSSFIIIAKTSKVCECCGRSDPNFIDLLPDYRGNCDSTHVDVRGLRNVLAEERGNYYLSVGTYWTEEKVRQEAENYKKFEEKLTNACKEHGDDIALIRISYHDTGFNALLESCEKSGSIVVVERW